MRLRRRMSGVGGFERVFCAVDKSDFSVRALQYAVALEQSHRAAVSLIRAALPYNALRRPERLDRKPATALRPLSRSMYL